ncbi:MAG: hypothetical protein IIB60_05235 [Planctomycetes bacterium]|nr:hypothetical protein [Planctomycetota bacterium]
MQRSVTAHLVEIGTARERVSTARQEIADYRQVAAGLAAGSEDGARLLDEIKRVVAEASGVRDAIQSAAGGAETTVGQLDSHTAAAKHVLHELSDVNVKAHGVVERVVTAIRIAQESADSVGEQADRITSDVAGLTEKVEVGTQKLTERQRAAEVLIERVDRSTQPAKQLVEQLIARTSEAQEQQILIADRCEQAGEFVERLSSMDRILHETMQAEVAARAVIEQARSLHEELTQLTEGGEQTLEKRRVAAEALIERVDAATKPAQEILEKLAQKKAQVEEQLAEMAQRCEQAGEVDTRLAALTQVLEAAEGAQASVGSTAEDARAVHQELADTTAGAKDQTAILSDLVATSNEMVDRHTELQQVSQQTVRELGEKMEANRNSNVAADRLLNEFNAQARTLERGIRTLQARAEEIEKAVNDATAKPAEMVTVAQAQAAQLERVCSAVRKVFAGLSKATLEARKQTETLGRASGEATDRFANLQTETQRASTTLHEWIEEAVRVQSRLQKTLQQAPSISETHPVDTLFSMSRAVDSARPAALPASRIANAGTGGELTMLSKPPADIPKREKLTVGKGVRSDQVSRLIEDAKRAGAHEPANS